MPTTDIKHPHLTSEQKYANFCHSTLINELLKTEVLLSLDNCTIECAKTIYCQRDLQIEILCEKICDNHNLGGIFFNQSKGCYL